MPRKILLKEGGLTGSIPTGFKAFGLDETGNVSILSNNGITTDIEAQFGFIAAENIPAGVGVSLLSSGEIVRTKNEFESFGFEFPNSTQYKTCQIGTDTMIYLYTDYQSTYSGTVYRLLARVVVNSEEEITVGSEQVITSGLYNDDMSRLDVCLIDSNRLFISYVSNSTAMYGYAIIDSLVVDITGTTVSLGNVQSFSLNSNYPGNTILSICSLSNSKVIIAYRDSNNYGYLREITVTGNLIGSIGARSAFYSNNLSKIKAVRIDSNKAALIYTNNNDYYTRCVIYSDTNILGSELVISNYNEYGFDALLINTDRILINVLNFDNFTIMRHHLLSISGLTSSLENTYQTSLDFSLSSINSDGNNSYYSKSVKISTDKILMLYGQGDNLSSRNVTVIDFSSGYQKYGDVVIAVDSSNLDACFINGDRVNVSFFKTYSSEINIISGEIVSNLFDNSSLNISFKEYIGFSQNTANSGETVYVKFPGSVDNNQSGLEIGKFYGINPNGNLITVGGTGTTNGERVLVGRAITESKILLVDSAL